MNDDSYFDITINENRKMIRKQQVIYTKMRPFSLAGHKKHIQILFANGFCIHF